jgi:RHS repeat-associated protein
MGRPTDWHVLDLDRDPVPGDPYEVKELARKLGDFADDVGSALRSVRGLGGDTAVLDWAGLSGDAYREQFGDLPGELDKLERSYRLASGALDDYWPQLETAQADADRALAQGRTARADLDAATSRLTNADAWVKRAQDKAKQYQDDPKRGVPPPSEADVRAATRNATDATNAHTTASTAVHDAQSRLDAAKELAALAAGVRDRAASTAEHALHEASDAGIKNKHWWEKAVDWVAGHWDDIVAVCKVIVAVLGIVVMIIGGPLAWIVLAAALIVLADTLIKYAQGKASLWDVAFAALDCIPGFKGLTTAGGLLKMARGLPALLKSGRALGNIANSVRKGAGAMRNAGRTISSLFTSGDPIDMATGEMVMSATDVRLPGILSLILERHHRTGFRGGRWFGASWASTLDQRLIIDDQGVRLATADGMLLHYPVPQADHPVMPVEGPRWPLTWDGTATGPMTVWQPEAGLRLHFRPLPDVPAGVLPIAAITDRHTNRVDFAYDAAGLPTEVVHSGGYRVAVTTTDGRITALHLASADDRPRLLAFGYTGRRLTSVTDSSGLPLTFGYDEAGRITHWQDRSDTRYAYTYDDQGRCVRTTGSNGILAYTYGYDDDARTTRATDSLGHTTTFTFNEARQLVRRTDHFGHATLWQWDRYDRLLSRTDPLGRTTRYAYNAEGRCTGITYPDASTASITYNEAGLPVSATDPDGAHVSQRFDARGSLLATTDAAGATTSYAYDERGALTAVTDPLGATRAVRTDSAGLPIAVVDADGRESAYVRDAFGRVAEAQDAAGQVVRTGWSVEGRPLWRRRPDGTTELWEYDAEGDLISYRDPAGGAHRFETTHFNLPAARIAPDGSRLSYRYDTELRLTEVRDDDGRTWSYAYDAVGNLVRESDFNGRCREYRYDAARQLTERVDAAGERVQYRRDSGGRVTRMVTPDGTSVFSYSPTGRMLRAENSAALVEFSYDEGGRLTAESCDGAMVASRYDAMGRRVARETPTGVESRWTYDDQHRPAKLRMAGGVIDFGYDGGGREVTRRLAGGARLEQSWDPVGRVTAQALIRSSDERVLQERRYAYRPDGYPTEIAERVGTTHRFALDALGRITDSTPHDGRGPAAQGVQEAQGSRVIRSGRVHYTYDEQGRVATKTRALLSGGRRRWRFRWDAEDRLRSVTGPDGSVAEYTYDALGRRTAKRLLPYDGGPEEITRFVWDGEVLAEQIHSGGTAKNPRESAITWECLLGESPRPAVQVHSRPPSDAAHAPQEEVDRRFLAVVTDVAGAPTELVGTDGEVVWRRTVTPWGRHNAPDTPATADGVDCPLRSPGRYHDDETGLDYNYHRYFDPETGRYLSPDPLGLAPGPDDYADVTNQAVLADPLGLSPCSSVINVFRGPSQGLPGGQLGAPVSIRQLRMALGRADMSVSDYDIVHVPEIHTPTGLAFGNSPHSGTGIPELGPRGLPLIQISDLGLRSMDEGVATVFHEIYHHQQFRLSLNSRPLWTDAPVAPSHIWGGTEDAAEEYGQRMLGLFNSRTG